jgi:DNA invertase Pin-like site-specific DNA recombinase
VSDKRSFNGHTGKCPTIYLINGLSDNKIDGQNNGQRGGNGADRYARVSTAEQDTALQTDALHKAGCERVFEDTVSGAKSDRLGLAAALANLRDGDVLVVWRLDRLGRSLPHLIETIGTLEGRGVGFRSLTEAIDTTTPGGRLIFHVFGALGQFERDLIRERTKAGLAAAATRGRKGGRKPVVTEDKLQRAKDYIANGLNVREAAARLKVGKTALYAILQSASTDQS